MGKHKPLLKLPHSHVMYYPSVAKELGPHAAVVYGYLLFRANLFGTMAEDGSIIWVPQSLSTIARFTGLLRRQVMRETLCLIEAGYLSRRVRGGTKKGHMLSLYGVVVDHIPRTGKGSGDEGEGTPAPSVSETLPLGSNGPYPLESTGPYPSVPQTLPQSPTDPTLGSDGPCDPKELLEELSKNMPYGIQLASLVGTTEISSEQISETEKTETEPMPSLKPKKQAVHTSAKEVADVFADKQATFPDPPETAKVSQLTTWWQGAIAFYLGVKLDYYLTPKDKANAKHLHSLLGKKTVPFVVAVVRKWDSAKVFLSQNYKLSQPPKFPSFGLMLAFVNPLNEWFAQQSVPKYTKPVPQVTKVVTQTSKPKPAKPKLTMDEKSALEWLHMSPEERLYFIAQDLILDQELPEKEALAIAAKEFVCRSEQYEQKYSTQYPQLVAKQWVTSDEISSTMTTSTTSAP